MFAGGVQDRLTDLPVWRRIARNKPRLRDIPQHVLQSGQVGFWQARPNQNNQIKIGIRLCFEPRQAEMLEQGQIDNAAAVISLQWFALHKQKVLDNWRK